MDREGLLKLAGVALLAVLLTLVLGQYIPATATLEGDTASEAELTVQENNSTLGIVAATVSDDPEERRTGLSNTESLAPAEGMLFVYHSSDERTFVMREMDFPLDIIFIDATGQITAIHEAPVPPANTSESELEGYSGRAKWVLEANRGWAAYHNVTVGDSVQIDYGTHSE